MFNMKKNITLIMLSIALFTGFNSLLFAEKNKENSMSYVGKWVFHSIMSMDESDRTVSYGYKSERLIFLTVKAKNLIGKNVLSKTVY